MPGDEAGAAATVVAPRARRGRYAKSTVTRAAILDAALDVFSEDGYRTGSLHEIARRVNITEPGVLHHFGSKPKLLAAVLARRDELSEQRMPRSSTDGVVMLRGVLGIAEHNATEPGVLELYCMLAAEASSPEHPAHEYFANRYDDVRERVGRAFADLEQRGLLRPGIEPEFAARATVAFMDGLKVQWLIDRTVLDMSEDLRRFLNAVTLVGF